jgi:hypothetical protein
MVAQKKSMARASTTKKAGAEKSATNKSRPHREGDDSPILLERRASHERRNLEERRTEEVAVAVEQRVLQRRVKVSRRRQIDPTTCERDYTPDEIEFMGAMDEYKRLNGRMFPTCSEVLEVLKKLGYEKRPIAEAAVSLPVAELSISASAEQAVL